MSSMHIGFKSSVFRRQSCGSGGGGRRHSFSSQSTGIASAPGKSCSSILESYGTTAGGVCGIP
jgi:hypothetical protein